MPSDRYYGDDEVLMRVGMVRREVAAMLRALLADRRRLEAHRAALLAEVRAWRAEDAAFMRGSDVDYLNTRCALGEARRATDALLGAEIETNPNKEMNSGD